MKTEYHVHYILKIYIDDFILVYNEKQALSYLHFENSQGSISEIQNTIGIHTLLHSFFRLLKNKMQKYENWSFKHQ